jgi:hypothetical protein
MLLLYLLTISYQSIKAAIINPVKNVVDKGIPRCI